MILIEVNNRKASSNLELLARTQNWVASNMPEIGNDYVIVMNPNIKGDLKISHHDPRESTNAPHETTALDNETINNTIATHS